MRAVAARTARPRRSPATQLEACERLQAGVGHNGGPPLDNSGAMFLWRRAVKRSWATPPREIALRRIAEAEALGLSYREYVAVLKDRGQRIRGVIVVADGLSDLMPSSIVDRLARLNGVPLCVTVRLPVLQGSTWRPDDAVVADLLRGDRERLVAGWIRRRRVERFPELPTLDERIAALAARFDLPSGALFMVGSLAADHAAAQRSGLALYRSWHEYFAR